MGRLIQNINPYNPQTEIGAENAEVVGKLFETLTPVALMFGKVAALQAGLKTATPAIEYAANSAVQSITRTAGKTAEVIRSEAGGIKFRIYIDLKTGKITNYHPE